VSPLSELRAAVQAAAAAVAPPGVPNGGFAAAGEDVAAAQGGDDGASRIRSAPTLERPPRLEFGDYSTNVALLLAPTVGQPPRAVAELVGADLARRLGAHAERVEVAGPGFLNIFLADEWFRASAALMLEEGDAYGGGGAQRPEYVDVEFVSANPTGPLHVAHGRHAAYGDSLCRIVEFHGHRVEREFYVNDWGSQVRRLGESILARARGEQVPEDGYQGDYVGELVDLAKAREMDVDQLARAGVAACLERIQRTLSRFGVTFDTWFFESSLHPVAGEGEDKVTEALAALERADAVYRSEGALWLRTTSAGDDKDRVLQRSNGEYTYLASDVAYHLHKLARGYDRLIDVLGADHHGYVQRMRAAWMALGGRPEALEQVIMQFVHVLERGERASMSKRRGEFVTLDELIDQIGVDAARFFLLTRSHDMTVDLDLDLAREQSSENPVYYVQYAHARIASMLARAGSERVSAALDETGTSSEGLGESGAGAEELHPSERALVKKLVAFPGEVSEAAERRAPHRVAAFALELAQDFTAFYRDCRVVGAQPSAVESWRLGLSVATQRTIARALFLLGVSAPQAM
jgi:arginyl-tRNA synthetase